MKKVIVALVCVITALTLTGCSEDKTVNVNVENDSSIKSRHNPLSLLRSKRSSLQIQSRNQHIRGNSNDLV